MAKRNTIIIVILVLISVALIMKYSLEPSFICNDEIGCVKVLPGEPVKLGVIQDLSGSASAFGVDQLNSFKIALDDWNNQILGHPIELTILDEKCSAEGGANSMLRIVADSQIVGVLGTTCSGAAATASKIMSEAGLVMISGVNSGISLTSIAGKPAKDWYPGYYRTNPNQVLMTRGMAYFAKEELKLNKAAIVYANETYSQGCAETFKHSFTQQGGDILIEVLVTPGEKDMRPILEAISQADGKALFISLYPSEAILLIQQMRKMREFDDIVLLGLESLVRDDFIKAIGEDGVGLYCSEAAQQYEDKPNKTFLTKHIKKYGENPKTALYGYAYDAANILVKTIESAAIKQKNGSLYIGRQALRNTIYATSKYKGLSGILSCDSFGDLGVQKSQVIRLNNASEGVKGFKSNVVYSFSESNWNKHDKINHK